MAYNPKFLRKLSGFAGGFTLWEYRTLDSFATVCGSNYFYDGSERGMKVGDQITVNVFSTLTNYAYSGLLSQTPAFVQSVAALGGTASAPTFTGDSGSGGRAGLVPAPPAGSTAAGYVLLPSGSWGAPAVYASRAALAAAIPSPYTSQVAWVGSQAPYAQVVWNGAAWVAPRQSLAESAVAAVLTGSTSLTPLATITIPGGVMGTNSSLICTSWWTMTNNANNKTMYGVYGGAQTQFLGATLVSVATLCHQAQVTNRGASGAQIMNGNNTSSSYTANLPAWQTSSEDTTANQQVIFAGTLANSSDTLTLESYRIELVG